MHTLSQIKDKFISLYGKPALTISTSGRANIIGEHTDYYGGFVFPFAIDAAIYFCASTHQDKEDLIFSADFDEHFSSSENYNTGDWQNFVKATLNELKSRYSIDKNVKIVFGGDLPIGSGISSSSALCCGMIELFNMLFHLNIESLEKVNLASIIEHGAGVKGGKMDQYSIFFGQESKALLLDCQSMKNELIDVPKEWQFLLINSGVKHNLAHTAYNERRAQGEEAIRKINHRFFEAKTVREITDTILENCEDILTDKEHSRILHVTNENRRVTDFISCMSDDDLLSCGQLLNESHESLRDLYEVSCEELDSLQSLAKQTSFIYGSRMMGGGFGGCTINLIELLNEEELDHMLVEFSKRFGHKPMYYIVKAAQGIKVYE
jgi:galactokinase